MARWFVLANFIESNINSFNSLAVSLLATIVIWLYDANNNGALNMSPKEREIAASKL